MKRILVVALALVALMAFASCDPNMGGASGNKGGSSINVPETMQGTWRASGATLEASPNNIVITFDHGSTVDMNGIVAQGHGAYTIKSGTTTLDITANGGSVGYHFSVSGDTLTFRITSGIGNSMTFTRQE